jgi:hypothetical protein
MLTTVSKNNKLIQCLECVFFFFFFLYLFIFQKGAKYYLWMD